MTDPFALIDGLGPTKILHLGERRTGLRAVVVIDNVSAGPAIGGIRMAADADLAECAALARAMTLKNASAGLRHGGAKAVVIADPHQPVDRKEELIRAFAARIADVTDYIPGPDMGTDERCMAWVHDEIGRAVGLPAELGGIPLDELGMTGFGLVVATRVAARHIGMELEGARIAVQGLGAVGRHAARLLTELGCVLVAAADSSATVCDPDGLDLAALVRAKAAGGRLADLGDPPRHERDAIVGVDCDIWIPAARPHVLREDNVASLQARLVVQGANIPATLGAEAALARRGVLSVPDFIANAGGVICAATEYAGGSAEQAFATIEAGIGATTEALLERAEGEGTTPRDCAHRLAVETVEAAMSFRRWS